MSRRARLLSESQARLVHSAAVACLLLAVAVASSGCFRTSSGPSDVEEEHAYPRRTSPAKALEKLVEAYEAMDAEAYLDCLAEEFEFILNPDDVADPMNDLPESWGKPEERTIHEAMFSDTLDVTNVDLTLTNVSSQWSQGEDPVDPGDDTWEFIEQTDLRVRMGEWIFLASADQLFTFQIDPNETGPEGQDLWEIAVWEDMGEQGREESTWGGIKALFISFD